MRIEINDPRLFGIKRERLMLKQIEASLVNHPMVILSGSRKVGKTTVFLQLAAKTANAEYIDCELTEDVKRLESLFYEEDDVLLLIDEIQRLPRCQDWIQYLANKANNISTFRVVCTGSVAACMEILSRGKAGGGRSSYIHMPVITYLEYLYITSAISCYDVDLMKVEYKESFYDYMLLKGAEQFSIGPINKEYIERSASDMREAEQSTRVVSTLLDTNIDDIKNAFILLSYRLAQEWVYDDIFKTPIIGNNELQMVVSDQLRAFEEFGKFSVLAAARSSMSDEQIARALRYLLWNGLAVYESVSTDYGDQMSSILTTLYLGKEEAYTAGFVQKLFARGNTIFAVNPLIYSALSDELFDILEEIVSNNSRNSCFSTLISRIKQKLSSRKKLGFIADRPVLGSWVECYLKGSFARMTTFPPFRVYKFNDPSGREVDIVGSFPKAMIEVTVQRKDKTANNVNFHLFRKGTEPCILTTNRTFGVETMSGVEVMKIPYPMMAAFLDRGELPKIEYVKEVTNV